jgi:hypothetical protein
VKGPLGVFLALAAAILAAPVLEPWPIAVKRIEPDGGEHACAPEFARLALPDRATPRPLAFFDDLAYAASAAGEHGLATIVAAIALLALVAGLWSRGLRCGGRRLLLTLALGAPVSVALLYHSCFLEGRRLVLGPSAGGYVLANLHAHSDRSTGLLSPRRLVAWHAARGFRVMSVTDKNLATPSLEAERAARAMGAADSFLVVPGQEYQGDAHVVLLGARRDLRPRPGDLAFVLEEVRESGGGAILAHPWYGIRLPHPLERMLEMQIDGVEVVNRAVQGGMHALNAAKRANRALVGALDYKYGPHVTSVTLLPERMAGSLSGVVQALRERKTRVLFAVPGGTMAATSYDTRPLWLHGARDGVRSLLETPRPRRLVWIATLALFVGLWALATRRRAPTARTGLWRALFLAAALLELALLAPLSWQVRAAVGTVPVDVLVGLGALFAVPLLASAHNLACSET